MTTAPAVQTPTHSRANESSVWGLVISIVLPTVILKKLTPVFINHWAEHGAWMALVVALLLPITYGIYEYKHNGRRDWMAALGLINTLFTGLLALFHSDPFWFAMKEMSVPLCLGIGVLISLRQEVPLVRSFILKPQVINLPLIEERLKIKQTEPSFDKHLRLSTLFLSLPFFLSAFLNYMLARRVFLGVDPQLSEVQKTAALNQQIGDMTWISFLVIALPCMLCLMLVLWHVVSGIKKFTDLKLDEIFVT